MTTSTNSLFPLLKSSLLTDIATRVFSTPSGCTIKDLHEWLGVDRKNITTAVDTLVDADVLTSTRVGRSRLLKANTAAPFYEPLDQLLTIVQGPPAVVGQSLGPIKGVQGAYIYGSWAARSKGKAGPPPRDVDVLVLTTQRPTSRLRVEVHEALETASSTLKRPVSPTFATVEQWNNSADPFLQDVKAGDIIEALPVRGETAA